MTEESRKRLWARSGNRCALCRTELVQEDSDAGPGGLVGQEAHIVAKSPGGPRYMPLDPAERDGYANLILVCANDHRVIDTQAHQYSIDRLRDAKQAHETWVTRRLSVKVRSEETTELALVGSGDMLWQLVTDGGAWDLGTMGPLTETQENLADEALQLACDAGELVAHLQDAGLRAIRFAKRELDAQIHALSSARLVMVGGMGKALFGDKSNPDEVPVTVLRVLTVEQFKTAGRAPH